ncbi:hypothetical protein [Streptosporangium sp. NPDC004631]
MSAAAGIWSSSIQALDRLGVVGRLLMTSDGTITAMLEEITGDRIVTADLARGGRAPGRAAAILGHAPGQGALLVRSTNLVGAASGLTYVRARTVLVPDALPREVYRDLMGTRETIGRLLRYHRVETFREPLGGRLLRKGENPDPLDDDIAAVADRAVDGPEPEPVAGACRTYRVFIGGRPAALIGEVFAAVCFVCDCDPPVGAR